MENRFTFFYFFDLINHQRFDANCSALSIHKLYFKTGLMAMYHRHRPNITPN